MGKVLQFTKDTLTSLVSMMGTSRDKAATTFYAIPVWDDAQLINAYRGSWLARKIVNIPALDSMRKWRNWQTEKEVIELLEAEEKRLLLKTKLLETKIKARLFGGAALYIGTGDADPSQPLEPERIGTGGIKYLNVMLRRHLSPGEIDWNPESEWFGKPGYYTLSTTTSAIQSTQQLKIHPSRLVIFYGEPLPDDEMAVNVNGRGWGDSVLVSTMNAIKNSDATAANIASLVFESKVDIIRVPDLMANLMDPGYEERLLQRFQLAATAKGINATLLLDKDEEYEQKSASFAQLPDVLMAFMQLVSGAADIPATRLLGQAPIGMNSTGESDLRNYYDRIQASQELELTPAMIRLDECLIRSATGTRDPAIHFIWAPLWQLTDKERAEIGKIDSETIANLNNTGLFPPEALANAGANLLVEHSILPGLLEEIESAGGLPDYEAELEKERQTQVETAAAVAAAKGGGKPVQDMAPTPLYVRRDVLNKDEIVRWAKSQGFETVQEDLHVTIMHTHTPLDWMKLGNDYAQDADGKMRVPPGGPRAVEQFGEAVVLSFANTWLAWRHQDIKNAGAETDYPDYQPHITITWNRSNALALAEIEPYRGEIVLGPEIFEEVKDGIRSILKES